MNKDDLKKQCYVLGNTIGGLGAELYELNGKIAQLVIKDNMDKEYTELLREKEKVTKALEVVKDEFLRLEKLIRNM